MTTTPSITFATAPVNWNNFDLEGWRPVTPFPEILTEMKRAGYSLTEWDESFGTDPDALLQAASSNGVGFCGAYRWLDFQDEAEFVGDLAELDSRLHLLAAIGVRNLIVSDRLRPDRIALAGRAHLDPESSLSNEGYRLIAERVERLATRAAEFDIAVHYHNHVGTVVESPKEVEQLLGHLEGSSVGLCFDTGHYAYGGGDPVAFLREHGAMCTFIHLKDVAPDVLAESRANEWSFLEALRHIVFPPIGEGVVDLEAVFASLVSHKYRGLVVIEQDTCRDDPTEVAHRNLQHAQEALNRVTAS